MADHRKLVLALTGENENSVLRDASAVFGVNLATRGYRTLVLNMFDPAASDLLLQSLHSGEVAFAFAYAGIGAQFEHPDGGNLWTVTQTPFVALWYDPPAYNYPQHIVDSPYLLHIYHIRDHYETRRKFLPSTSARVIHFPRPQPEAPHHTLPHFRDRQRRFVYAKTGDNPAAISAPWRNYPKQLQDIMWAVVEAAQKDGTLDLPAETARLLEAAGENPRTNLKLFMGIVNILDGYIRAWRGDKLARALMAHEADIIGRGWEYLQTAPCRARFMPSMPPTDLWPMMINYRIMANSNPIWRYGLHERLLVGMAHGCLALTDRSIEGDRRFAGCPNYRTFDWQDDLAEVLAETWNLSAQDEQDYAPVVLNDPQETWPAYLNRLEAELAALRDDAVLAAKTAAA